MTELGDTTLNQDMAQVKAAGRLIYPGLSMRLRLHPEGLRVHAAGPCGAASTLLPGEGRDYLPTLKALCDQVCTDNMGGDAA